MAHKDQDRTLVVIVASFGNETEAGESLKDLKRMDKDNDIELVDAAVVVHDSEGKVHFKETDDPSGKTWAKRGAIAGGLVGLIFPPSLIAGAVVGGAGGGVWGKIRDKGFKDDDLKAVGEDLPPGSSAIIAIAADKVAERLVRGLTGYQKVTQHVMNADASAVLLAEPDPTEM
jgi:uncharacterized membrane protein